LVESRPMIFIVDDDPSVRKALKRLLSSAGFAVETFGSAEDVLKSGQRALADGFVVDVRMPGMSGLELQKELLAAGSRVPVIFITAHEDADARDAAMEAGATAFLQKPFDDRALLDAVETGLKRKALEAPNAGHLDPR
jgi:FixJ family two-component response regulator